jgi:putative chitinase
VTADAFFDAARALKRELTGEGLTQPEVDAFNAILATWRRKRPPNPTALADAQAFFKVIREKFGSLDQEQVEGFNSLLQAMGAASWPIAWAAYGLATAWHETNRSMQPVEEAYYLANKVKNLDAWRQKNLSRYYPWHGRGYVQLTWERNYKNADKELGLNGALIGDRSLALRPDIAAKIMVRGMEEGWFTGKKTSDYLPANGPATLEDYRRARPIINAMDKAALIAGQAEAFEAALTAGGWG